MPRHNRVLLLPLTASLITLVVAACATRPPQWFLANEWSAQELQLSGLQLRARQSEEPTGAGPNLWSASSDSVRIDDAGRLLLNVIEREGRWYSAEVSAPLPDSYCRLSFTIETDVNALDPSLIAAVFLYRNDQSEVDVELGRWGHPDQPNAQFVVAPPTTPDRIDRFELPVASAPVDFVIEWRASGLSFSSRTHDGQTHNFHFAGEPRPEPGGHRIHMSLWLRDRMPAGRSNLQLIVSKLKVQALDD